MKDWCGDSGFDTRPNLDRLAAAGRLIPVRNQTLRQLLGEPRGTYAAEGQPLENPAIRALIDTQALGRLTVTGLRPALRVLAAILADLARFRPAIHARLGVGQMLCARLARGSASVVSSHAWGVAVDLTLLGGVGRELSDVASHFRRHGFVWGGTFPVPEPLHFEASDQLVRLWGADGALGPARTVPVCGLTMGDRGGSVVDLQRRLNAFLPIRVVEDGLFGPATRAAVIEAQRRIGRPMTGVATPATIAALARP